MGALLAALPWGKILKWTAIVVGSIAAAWLVIAKIIELFTGGNLWVWVQWLGNPVIVTMILIGIGVWVYQNRPIGVGMLKIIGGAVALLILFFVLGTIIGVGDPNRNVSFPGRGGQTTQTGGSTSSGGPQAAAKSTTIYVRGNSCSTLMSQGTPREWYLGAEGVVWISEDGFPRQWEFPTGTEWRPSNEGWRKSDKKFTVEAVTIRFTCKLSP